MYQDYENTPYTFTRGGTVYTLPKHTKDGLITYAKHKVPTGSFLYAVLCNNLIEAVAHADTENIDNLPAITGFMYNEMPGTCWGSERHVADWLI